MQIYDVAYNPAGTIIAANDGDKVIFFEEDQIFEKEKKEENKSATWAFI